MFFQVISGGSYTHTDKKEYKAGGEVIETDVDLRAMFKNKFRQVSGKGKSANVAVLEEPREQAPKTSKKDDVIPAKKKGSKLAAAQAARGDDVSTDFASAEEEGFTVFRREKKFHVYEGDSTKPLNPKGLGKDEVEPFIKKYLEE